jgi:hypothetical protein
VGTSPDQKVDSPVSHSTEDQERRSGRPTDTFLCTKCEHATQDESSCANNRKVRSPRCTVQVSVTALSF